MPAENRGNHHDTVTGKLTEGLRSVASAAGGRVASLANERISRFTDQLTNYASGKGGPAEAAGAEKLKAGGSPAKAAATAGMASGKQAVKGVFGKGDKGGSDGDGRDHFKATIIVESIDVGVPVTIAYNQWTQFKDFPRVMKKVEDVEQKSTEQLTWKAQTLWSHRTWESTIIEQVPDERIVWKSKGEKGSVDGAVTFHELAPDLTRIIVVLEYHPQGFVERTGNLWRAQGRRARLELKHFVRHVMTETLLDPDQVQGWRGEIRDGEVVREDDRSADESGAEGQSDEAERQPDGAEAQSDEAERPAEKAAEK